MGITFGKKKKGETSKDKDKDKGLFSKKKKKDSKPQGGMQAIQEQLMSLTRRLRVLEEQQTNLRRKLQLVEQNMLSNNKRFKEETKAINSDIVEIKRGMSDLENKSLLIIKELKGTARKDDVEKLNKYIDLWEPIEFITREQAKNMIDRALKNQ